MSTTAESHQCPFTACISPLDCTLAVHVSYPRIILHALEPRNPAFMSTLHAHTSNALTFPVTRLPGIGSVRAHALREIGVATVNDLLQFIPRRYLDRSTMLRICDLRVPPMAARSTTMSASQSRQEVTIIGTIGRIARVPGRTRRTVVTISDGTGTLDCVWFGAADWIERVFSAGDQVAVSGAVKRFRAIQMTHPEIESLGESEEDLVHMGRVIPIYSQPGELSSCGLHSRGMRRLIRKTLDYVAGRIIDPVPVDILSRQALLPLTETFRQAHFPDSFAHAAEARRRLVFDEFFGLELAVVRRKFLRARESSGIEFPQVGERFTQLLNRLPFELTNGQKQVLREIRRDMRSSAPMSRLLQGDVGSGKTLVALFCAVMAADNGYQTAIMAPTEVLAEQHALTVGRLLFEVGIDCVLITGSISLAQRRRATAEIAAGQVPVVIGTHALLSGDLEFHKLGLVIVDEQHRFGVLQRNILRSKGNHGTVPDLLVMTATPIPRSLAQTLYGDLDVSVLSEKPPGRQPIITIRCPVRKPERAWRAVREAIERGEQAYVVFPLIDQSEKMDLKAVTEGYEELRNGPLKGCRMGLLHGRMSPGERDRTMGEFTAGQLDLLASTTVIEVGVDVPNATTMVIEGAERFGLAQLHQLRGRIGRGAKPSACYLVPGAPLTEDAKQRMDAITKSNDGFYLAEVDLEIRGPGEFFGTRQSGMPEFRLAHVVKDALILAQARDEACMVLEHDVDLQAPEHIALQALAKPHEQALAEAEKRSIA